jgi:hypothetical protein
VISQNEPEMVSRPAAEIGARGFIPKGDLSRDLLAIIDGVAKGRDDEEDDREQRS